MATTIAVLGAGSLIAENLLEQMDARDFPVQEVRLIDNDDSGRSIMVKGHACRIRTLEEADLKGVELIFNCGPVLAPEQRDAWLDQQISIIDLSAQAQGAQLLIPEVNGERLEQAELTGRGYYYQVPSAASITAAMALAALNRRFTLLRVNLVSLHTVSDYGHAGVKALAGESARLLNGRDAEAEFFSSRIAFNLIPGCEREVAEGECGAEVRLAEELPQLLDNEQLEVVASSVQLPLFYGQTVIVHGECQHPLDLQEAATLLKQMPGVHYAQDEWFTPADSAAGEDAVFVARLRLERDNNTGFALVAMTDNLRKGSALNALQIAEQLFAWLDR